VELGTLYLVPTPIGHPRDITLRAIDVLGSVDLIAAEDTRHARTLLQPHAIGTRLVSYHDHNEQSRTGQLLEALRAGQNVALISDAGTPMVNDPGYRLVTAAIEAGLRVVPLPGPSAAISALVGSGLPVHRFCYVGFLPRKAAARQAALQELRGIDASLILFEAPHRLLETVRDARAVLGDRRAALARSISKPDEQFLRGTLAELEADLAGMDTVRGQYTVVVAGADPVASTADRAEAGRIAGVLLANGADPRLTRAAVQELTGLARNEVYELVAGLTADRRTAERPA
jgi:16S rRNA (cytidine1402-2'-O)-methyltransferase